MISDPIVTILIASSILLLSFWIYGISKEISKQRENYKKEFQYIYKILGELQVRTAVRGRKVK